MAIKALSVVVPSDGELWWRHGTGFRPDGSSIDELFLFSNLRGDGAFYRLYGSADDMEGTAGTSSFGIVDWGVPQGYTLGDVVDGKWTRAAEAGAASNVLAEQVEIYRERTAAKMEALFCKLSGYAINGRPERPPTRASQAAVEYLAVGGGMKQPTQLEVINYASKVEAIEDAAVAAVSFYDWAEARGWMISYGVPMTDWKAEFNRWWEVSRASKTTD